jgi:hypothetical protein
MSADQSPAAGNVQTDKKKNRFLTIYLSGLAVAGITLFVLTYVIAAADLTSVHRRGPQVLKVSGSSLVPDFLLTVHVAATARAANAPGSVVVLTTVRLVHLESNEVVWMKIHRTRQRIS